MTDIIEQAEKILNQPSRYLGRLGLRYQEWQDALAGLVPELLAELKAARAENERLGQAAWIKTVAELRRLKPTPELLGGVLIKSVGVPSFGGVFELNDDGTWNEFDSDLDRVEPEDIPLPVIVLWIPR